ncbi:hypothetical protein EI94DRAFT_1562909, partial [Lactarius quietus]
VIFKPGINRDGWFTSANLLQQVDYAIDIFEGKTKGNSQGLFLFDNAPSHRKRAGNALSAKRMPKDESRMCQGVNPLTGESQSVMITTHLDTYFTSFTHPCSKCPPDRDNCCCQTLLFNQPDFVSQKSELEELIEKCGHFCDFYPKYHCELNYIEQYWGAAKLRF